MVFDVLFYLLLVVYLLVLVILSRRIKIAYPVMLVCGGMLLCFIPGIPRLNISPDVIFLIFLPPLLYEAAWYTSWKDFWRWRRVICSFAFVIVLITSLLVAWVAVAVIPGFTLPLGLLLGGIVSPPDAVSAGAILKHIKVPRRVVAILEGESLLNDASSLIVFRYSLIAVSTGQFVFHQAAQSFMLVIAGGVGVGVAIAFVLSRLHTWLRMDVNSEIVFTLITPYLLYVTAEQLHVSGVLSVVSGGLFLSSKSHLFLSRSSRLRGSNVWSVLAFLLNGLVFLIIGLELPVIVAGLGDTALRTAILFGVLIAFVLMVSRVICALFASAFTMFVSRYITTADSRPGWKGPLVFGWAGMRGVVSLAAALSIPVYAADGSLFPERNLILFITFIVILLTLVLQGLTLPLLIRSLDLEDRDKYMPREVQEREIRKFLYESARSYIQEQQQVSDISQTSLEYVYSKLQHQFPPDDDDVLNKQISGIYLGLLQAQRERLAHLNQEPAYDDEVVRHFMLLLDMEEDKLLH